MSTDAARSGIAEPPLEPPAVPAWFQPGAGSVRPAARSKARRRKPVVETSRAGEQPPLSRTERLRLRLLGISGRSYAFSLLFHIAALVLMAIVIFEALPKDDRSTLLLDAPESDTVSLSEIDTRIDLPAAEEDLVPPQFQSVPIPQADTDLKMQADLQDMLPAMGAIGEGAGGGAGLMLPRGENAVSRGSFTVWTLPEKPKMSEEYDLIIEVKLPEKVKRYRISDLDGVIRGTDGFETTIPFGFDRMFGHTIRPRVVKDGRPVRVLDRNEALPIVDGVVQLIIDVPGAAIEKVHERIIIRSTILKERQVLDFVFETVEPDLRKPKDLFLP